MTDTDPRAPGRAEDHADAGAEGSSGASSSSTEPPPFNRRYLESRLAYRIQELAYGGLKPETVRRLEALGEQLRRRQHQPTRRIRARRRPIAGTRLIREWQGVEHVRHRARRRLRVAGPALQVALRHRPRHHRHALERPGVLRPQEPAGRGMTKPRSSASSAARSTPASPPRKGWSRSSTRLDAQREACEAYIASQRSEGWVLVRDRYDDGGFSGGTLERPALKRLLADIEDGLVDVVVVYKIDRLSAR